MKKLLSSVAVCFVFVFLGVPAFCQDTTNVNNYSQLKNAINNHRPSITLTRDITFGDEALTVTNDVTLTSEEGSNYAIKGNSLSPMLTFTGKSSTISNISFSSATTSGTVNPGIVVDIAAASTSHLSTFTISGVNFNNNQSSMAGGTGGALKIISEQYTNIINTNFSSNSATGTGAQGGALYYSGSQNLLGENLTFSSNTSAGDGGAIYASNIELTGSVFKNNKATAGNGGAIYASTITLTGNGYSESTNTGDFVNNTAGGNGGAIYVLNNASIEEAKISLNTAGGNGGAIYAGENATVDMNRVRFTRNEATNGGAIYNAGNLTSTNFRYENNIANERGGAIYNTGDAAFSYGTFAANVGVLGGGAIYNTGNLSLTNIDFRSNSGGPGGTLHTTGITNMSRVYFGNSRSFNNGGAIYASSTTLNFNGSNFLANNSATGLGGAIYANDTDINLNPDGEDITFQDNKDSGDRPNDIYMDGTSSLNISGGGSVHFGSGIIGGSISSTDTHFYWAADEGYAGDLDIINGSLSIMNTNDVTFGNITLNSAALSMQNDNITAFNASNLNITGEIPLYIDVDIAGDSVDTITGIDTSSTGHFVISSNNQLNILTDGAGTHTFLVADGADFTVNQNEDFYGPLYVYHLMPSAGGFKTVKTSRLNPTVSALPVAANSKVVSNVNTVNSLYNRIDVMLSRDYLDYHQSDELMHSAQFRAIEEEMASVAGETISKKSDQLVWFIPNAGYQKVDFGNDVEEVKNTFYGGLIGVDFPFWLSDTSAFIPTFFAGYLGSSQKYQGTTLKNNSLAVGGMLTYRKDFAILSAQAYVANGSEDYSFDRYSGTFDALSFTAALKGELDLEITDKFVLQPALTAIYNLSSMENYTTASLARMESTKFRNFLITPGVKIMGSFKGWYPYIGASYNFSEKQSGRVLANNEELARYKLKSFGEFSVGLENTFLKDYSGYVQVSAYTGSSKGMSFQMGLRGYLD